MTRKISLVYKDGAVIGAKDIFELWIAGATTWTFAGARWLEVATRRAKICDVGFSADAHLA